MPLWPPSQPRAPTPQVLAQNPCPSITKSCSQPDHPGWENVIRGPSKRRGLGFAEDLMGARPYCALRPSMGRGGQIITPFHTAKEARAP